MEADEDTHTYTHTGNLNSTDSSYRNKFTNLYFFSTNKSKICHGFHGNNY